MASQLAGRSLCSAVRTRWGKLLVAKDDKWEPINQAESCGVVAPEDWVPVVLSADRRTNVSRHHLRGKLSAEGLSKGENYHPKP